MSARRLDASALRRWAHAAVSELIRHTDEINALNVFPVPDADTGTNMLFTMRAAWAQADARADVDDVTAVAAALADGALRGARGNSGVILSQILRALADVTAAAAEDRVLADVDGPLLAAALRHAVTLVVTSMGEVVPGTITSVLQAAAAAAEDAVAEQADLIEVVTLSAQGALAALDRTPSQLEVLADAGVVDAGGRGLLVLLDALITTLAGHAPARPRYRPEPAESAAPATPATAAAPQFEVMYLLSGCDSAGVDTLRSRLEDLGESVAIAASGAGEPDRYSVHVHVDDAGAAVEAALEVGTPSRIQITSLSSGADRHPAGGWVRERAVLAVVDGDGAATLFAGEGAQVLHIEPGVPVGAHQLLHALVNTGAEQVMVLPNGYVAAEELLAGWAVASDWGIVMVPVPTGSMVQGLVALAVHDPAHRLVDDGYTMVRAVAGARYGSVRVAAEEALTWAGTCKPGDGLGIAGDEVVIVSDGVVAAGAGLIDLLLAAGGELVTVLTGLGVDATVADALLDHVRRHHPGTEMVTFDTGHHGDALLIGVE
ncbi:DAK2 domain-containing protein [Mycolicibacterium rufum]|uniref:DAK2 domain-containing protein n=1 Tax=Mycolicibacterium rufum TaxID=318424 RepID=A0ABY3UGA6_9MYCO|nr:DAK2 domain-containing protein [Mycolicibacterium rufum]KGI70776.1 dihydroxyacetone kinase [Mycolicibacterium rufum]ULP38653.1 DAK2 domain-containing protein [Mycolicibacterium rufum]